MPRGSCWELPSSPFSPCCREGFTGFWRLATHTGGAPSSALLFRAGSAHLVLLTPVSPLPWLQP